MPLHAGIPRWLWAEFIYAHLVTSAHCVLGPWRKLVACACRDKSGYAAHTRRSLQTTNPETHTQSYYLLMQPRAHAHAALTRSGPANTTVCKRASKRDEEHISCTWLYTAYRDAAVERWKPERHRQETACKCCEKLRGKTAHGDSLPRPRGPAKKLSMGTCDGKFRG